MSAPLEIKRIPIGQVYVGDRKRPLDKEKVETLAQSIRDNGLLQPIIVGGPIPFNAGLNGKRYSLVAGAHRLAAAKLLGWTEIDAINRDTFDPATRDCDDYWPELAEIAENLHRKDLTPAERDQHIRLYAGLLEDKAKVDAERAEREAKRGEENAKPRHGVAVSENKGGRGNKGTAAKIAAEIGLSKRTVQRALAESDNRHGPVSDNGTDTKPRRDLKAIREAIGKRFADAKWRSLATIASELNAPRGDVDDALSAIRSRPRDGLKAERRGHGRSFQYRIWRMDAKANVSLDLLCQELTPIIEQLQVQAKRTAGTMSNAAVSVLAQRLSRLLDEWRREAAS